MVPNCRFGRVTFLLVLLFSLFYYLYTFMSCVKIFRMSQDMMSSSDAIRAVQSLEEYALTVRLLFEAQPAAVADEIAMGGECRHMFRTI